MNRRPFFRRDTVDRLIAVGVVRIGHAAHGDELMGGVELLLLRQREPADPTEFLVAPDGEPLSPTERRTMIEDRLNARPYTAEALRAARKEG